MKTQIQNFMRSFILTLLVAACPAAVAQSQNLVSIVAADASASEAAADMGVLTLHREGSVASNLTVQLVISGTAVAGSDYVPLPSAVVFPELEYSVSVVLTPIADYTLEAEETVVVTLAGGVGYGVGSSSQATITISGDRGGFQDFGRARSLLFEGRRYLAGFPEKGRNKTRQDYLEVDENGSPTGSIPGFDLLQEAIDIATSLRTRMYAVVADLELNQLLAWEALEALLQGQLIAGNGNFLKGQRVAFPFAEGVEKPGGDELLPVGCPGPSYGGEYYGARIADLCYARLHFFRGIVSAMNFMANDRTGDIRAVDFLKFPLQPQYTTFNSELLPDPNYTNEAPIQTSAYLLGNLLDRYGKATVGMGDRLWRAAYFDRSRSPGGSRASERPEMLEAAMTELQRGVHSQFLAALPLAATLPEGELGYGRCRIDQVRVTAATAGSFIDRIRRGEMPKLDDLELDSSTESIKQQIGLTERLNTAVKEKHAAAETILWRVKDAEERVIEDAKALRVQFIDALFSATGIDPRDENSGPYYGLTTEPGRQSYRQAVAREIGRLAKEEIDSPDLTMGSELGQAVLQMLRAFAEIESAKNRRDAIPAQIAIEEQRVGGIIATIKSTGEKIGAYHIAIGLANAFTTSVSAGFPEIFSVSTSFNPGAIVSGALQGEISRAQALQEMEINRINSAATVKNLLLQEHQYDLDLKSAAAQGQLAVANYNALRARIDRLIENLVYYQKANEKKWYSDPALVFEQEQKEIDYENALREFIRETYILTQMLAARWCEPFENPYWKGDGRPEVLGAGQYDDFTQAESAFNLYEASECDDFLLALFTWDTKLRGERQGGEANSVSRISLRNDILGFSDIVYSPSRRRFEINPDPAVREWNRRRFRAFLLRSAQLASPRYWLRLEFPITYGQYSRSHTGAIVEQSALILAPRAAWNTRVKEITLQLEGGNIAQSWDNTLFVQLSQHGKLEFPRYHPRNPEVYPNFLTFNLPLYYPDPEDALYSPFSFFTKAGINGFEGVPYFPEIEPTPFCDNYVLLIERQANPPVNVDNIEDILITFRWESGTPPSFYP